MSVLPYSIMIGAIVLSLAAGLYGTFSDRPSWWIIPAIIIPLVAIYAVVDRRLKRSEEKSEGSESEAVHTAEGGASGAR